MKSFLYSPVRFSATSLRVYTLKDTISPRPLPLLEYTTAVKVIPCCRPPTTNLGTCRRRGKKGRACQEGLCICRSSRVVSLWDGVFMSTGIWHILSFFLSVLCVCLRLCESFVFLCVFVFSSVANLFSCVFACASV